MFRRVLFLSNHILFASTVRVLSAVLLIADANRMWLEIRPLFALADPSTKFPNSVTALFVKLARDQKKLTTMMPLAVCETSADAYATRLISAPSCVSDAAGAVVLVPTAPCVRFRE